jgi:hypothetical protein
MKDAAIGVSGGAQRATIWTNPVLSSAKLSGISIAAADPSHKFAMNLADQPEREREFSQSS